MDGYACEKEGSVRAQANMGVFRGGGRVRHVRSWNESALLDGVLHVAKDTSDVIVRCPMVCAFSVLKRSRAKHCYWGTS